MDAKSYFGIICGAKAPYPTRSFTLALHFFISQIYSRLDLNLVNRIFLEG